ncbi:hypothetical protein E1A91_D13G115300v1, partial [Gossypium mustelinum]
NGRSRGRGLSFRSRVQCQLCGKSGHLVDRCYHRFDASYKNIDAGMSPSVSSTIASMLQAYVATPATVADNTWYPDSGATHYLTNSASSLGEPLAYNGPGKVYVGNDTALPVLSMGQSTLSTSSRHLYMKSLLHVPGITKSLLSVSKFTKDNQVMVEFYPTQCQVRD